MTESQIHRAILQYLRLAMPRALIHHSANEVALSGKDVARAIGKAKGLGMLPGFPDIAVFPGAHIGPLFFEVKTPRGTLSAAQRAVMGQLIDAGYRYAVVRSVTDAQERLAEWGIWQERAIPLRGTIL